MTFEARALQDPLNLFGKINLPRHSRRQFGNVRLWCAFDLLDKAKDDQETNRLCHLPQLTQLTNSTFKPRVPSAGRACSPLRALPCPGIVYLYPANPLPILPYRSYRSQIPPIKNVLGGSENLSSLQIIIGI